VYNMVYESIKAKITNIWEGGSIWQLQAQKEKIRPLKVEY